MLVNFITAAFSLHHVIHPLCNDFLNAGLPHLDLIDEPGGLGKLPVILAEPTTNLDRGPEHIHGEGQDSY